MTLDDANDAAAVLKGVLTDVRASAPGASGVSRAELLYACSDLLTSALDQIGGATLGTGLERCFNLAVASGATYDGMDAVRRNVLASSLTGQPAAYVAGASMCYALVAQARILSATTFTSSTAVRSALSAIQAGFDTAEEWAADNHMPDLYQDMLAQGAAITRDLTIRAAPLPRLTTFSFPRPTTSHALAYRLYGNANRADELRAENGIIAPAFMPASGTALSE